MTERKEGDLTSRLTCPSCHAVFRVSEADLGHELKCPSCARPISASAPTAIAEPAVLEALPAEPPSVSAAEPGARQRAGPATRRCPRCGRQVPWRARRCRFCRAWLDEDEEEEWVPAEGRVYEPCPQCGARGATRVIFTFWGSFYGPLLFTHVRCPECGYAYNGRTGRSNLIPAILFVTIPLILILAIIGGLVYLVTHLH